MFNTPPFSLLTTTNQSSLSLSLSTCLSLYEPKYYAFTKEKNNKPLTSNHEVYDPTHPNPEPTFTSSASLFDGSFGIPFSSSFYFTHVRDPHPTEIFTLYVLTVLIPLYPTILSSIQIRSLVLHILSFPIMQHITNTFHSHIVPPIIPSSHHSKCISIDN